MKISELHSKALHHPHIVDMESNPNLTFQEFVLYWGLRGNATNNNEATEETLAKIMEYEVTDAWINKTWLKTEASKHHKKEIIIPWMDVFKQ